MSGNTFQRWGHVRLFSPFGMNSTPLGWAAILKENPQHKFPAEGDCTTGKEHVANYLTPLAKTVILRDVIRTDTQVLGISRKGLLKEEGPGDPQRGRQPFRLLLREAQAGGKSKEHIEEADLVIDCTGTYGQHRWLGDGGIPAAGELLAESQISYALDDVLGEQGVLRRQEHPRRGRRLLGGHDSVQPRHAGGSAQ